MGTTESQTPAKNRPVAGPGAQLARRYATALYELAHEQNALDPVLGDARALKQIIHESAELSAVLHHPRLTRGEQTKAMQALATAAKYHKLTQNFLALVAQNRRLGLLAAMMDALLAEAARRKGEQVAEVISAQPLTPAQAEKLLVALREAAGGKLTVTFGEDRGLLGGLTVKMGSRFLDASLKTKLQRLARHLKEVA